MLLMKKPVIITKRKENAKMKTKSTWFFLHFWFIIRFMVLNFNFTFFYCFHFLFDLCVYILSFFSSTASPFISILLVLSLIVLLIMSFRDILGFPRFICYIPIRDVCSSYKNYNISMYQINLFWTLILLFLCLVNVSFRVNTILLHTYELFQLSFYNCTLKFLSFSLNVASFTVAFDSLLNFLP